MFNECLEIKLNTAYFASLKSLFHHHMKHHEVSQKYSAARLFSPLFSVFYLFLVMKHKKNTGKKRSKGNNAHLFINTHAHPSRLKHRFDLHLIY